MFTTFIGILSLLAYFFCASGMAYLAIVSWQIRKPRREQKARSKYLAYATERLSREIIRIDTISEFAGVTDVYALRTNPAKVLATIYAPDDSRLPYHGKVSRGNCYGNTHEECYAKILLNLACEGW